MTTFLFVAFSNPVSALEFESDELKIDNKTGKVVLTGNVRAWDDTGMIEARRLIIRYVSGGDTVESLEAFGNVKLDYSKIYGEANYAYRDVEADTVLMQRNAYLKRDKNEFWAETIRVNIRTSEVKMQDSVRGNLRPTKQSNPASSDL